MGTTTKTVEEVEVKEDESQRTPIAAKSATLKVMTTKEEEEKVRANFVRCRLKSIQGCYQMKYVRLSAERALAGSNATRIAELDDEEKRLQAAFIHDKARARDSMQRPGCTMRDLALESERALAELNRATQDELREIDRLRHLVVRRAQSTQTPPVSSRSSQASAPPSPFQPSPLRVLPSPGTLSARQRAKEEKAIRARVESQRLEAEKMREKLRLDARDRDQIVHESLANQAATYETHNERVRQQILDQSSKRAAAAVISDLDTTPARPLADIEESRFFSRSRIDATPTTNERQLAVVEESNFFGDRSTPSQPSEDVVRYEDDVDEEENEAYRTPRACTPAPARAVSPPLPISVSKQVEEKEESERENVDDRENIPPPEAGERYDDGQVEMSPLPLSTTLTPRANVEEEEGQSIVEEQDRSVSELLFALSIRENEGDSNSETLMAQKALMDTSTSLNLSSSAVRVSPRASDAGEISTAGSSHNPRQPTTPSALTPRDAASRFMTIMPSPSATSPVLSASLSPRRQSQPVDESFKFDDQLLQPSSPAAQQSTALQLRLDSATGFVLLDSSQLGAEVDDFLASLNVVVPKVPPLDLSEVTQEDRREQVVEEESQKEVQQDVVVKAEDHLVTQSSQEEVVVTIGDESTVMALLEWTADEIWRLHESGAPISLETPTPVRPNVGGDGGDDGNELSPDQQTANRNQWVLLWASACEECTKFWPSAEDSKEEEEESLPPVFRPPTIWRHRQRLLRPRTRDALCERLVARLTPLFVRTFTEPEKHGEIMDRDPPADTRRAARAARKHYEEIRDDPMHIADMLIFAAMEENEHNWLDSSAVRRQVYDELVEDVLREEVLNKAVLSEAALNKAVDDNSEMTGSTV